MTSTSEKLKGFKNLLLSIPYREGQWDCAMILAFWAEAVEGKPYYLDNKGSYDSKLSGLRWLDGIHKGARSCADALPRFLSDLWSEVDSGSLEDGDFAALDDGSVGIVCEGSVMSCIHGKTGYMIISSEHVTGGWKFNGKEAL